MIRAVMFCVLTLAAAACGVQAVTPGEGLPYYDSADFTPRWVRSVHHRIADFDLVSQTGARVTRADLLGQVHVASFIYTRCAGICPAMVTQLSKVQRVLVDEPRARLVSYTATPQVDTPDTLAAFGAERGIDPRHWLLVTGDPEQIYGLARTSYFADDGRLSAQVPAAEQFLHTEKALLVDRDGRLRGVYNATLPHEINKLLSDLRALLDQT
jgi:protein SCO1